MAENQCFFGENNKPPVVRCAERGGIIIQSRELLTLGKTVARSIEYTFIP